MKRKLMLCAAVIAAFVFIYSGSMLYKELKDMGHTERTFDDIKISISENPNLDVIEDEGVSAYDKYVGAYEQNSDFVGWICIENTNVDYPVMQTPNAPDFYLKHSFDKKYSNYGVPYVQWNCVIGESDNLLIHGHNMKNTTMFSDLCKYENVDFYNEHKLINFDTLSEYGVYEIVAVLKTVAYSEDCFEYNDFVKAESEAEFDAFIKKCKELALYETDVNAQYGDKLITLSTCDFSVKDGRIAIVAKLIESTDKK